MVDLKIQVQRLQVIEKEIIKSNLDKFSKQGIVDSIRLVEDELWMMN